MIKIYKTIDKKLELLTDYQEGCWVNMVDPTLEEISEICEKYNIDRHDISSALDEEERAHIENAEDYRLIIVDAAFKDPGGKYEYITVPFEIIVTQNVVITVCSQALNVLKDFENSKIRQFSTQNRSRFILQVLYKNASYYLSYLRMIDRASERFEQEMHKSKKNSELTQLLDLEKSLVYFSTSLRANEMVLEKILRLETIELKENDREFLEDVIIENKQAIEMANVYSNILNSMMSAFSSLISNNLNTMMNKLTYITILISIPMVISSFFGMNMAFPFQTDAMQLEQGNTHLWFFILCISIIVPFALGVYMMRRKLF